MRFSDVTSVLFRAPRKIMVRLSRYWNLLRFRAEGVEFGGSCVIEGCAAVYRRKGARIIVGDGFHLTGGHFINKISRTQSACICAEDGAVIRIGKNVGMSSPAMWARTSITVNDSANIGADCIIMDHDAHSLDWQDRRDYDGRDRKNIRTAPVVIGEDALIGARSIILKGVTVGNRSIVGAGSVVACDIPDDEIWAGAPAKFIRKIQ